MKDAVVAATTMKADPDQAERFVRRNLAGGVDHFVVFLDAPSPAVREVLDGFAEVTVVRTGPNYWNGTRPPRVSDRLRINMNLANAVLATVPSVGWMVSIDADEAVSLDRDVLAGLEVRALMLSVLEAVARRSWPDDEPTQFKARPTDGELAALAALGSISEPDLAQYFRGHQEGKPALRPDLRVRLKVHAVLDAAGHHLAERDEDLHVLHYESHSLDDFVRRWQDYDPGAAHLRTHRDERKRLGIALHTLHHHHALDEATRDVLVGRLFDRRVADDVETLDALGLLVPPPARDVRPRPLPPGDLEHLERLLEAMYAADKHVFNDGGTPEQAAEQLLAAADRLGEGPAEQVRRTVAELRSG